MNYIRSLFNPATLPCTIDSIAPSIMPPSPSTQFGCTSTFLEKISISHIFTLNPSHYQISTILATKSSIFNILHESSGTHCRFIHNMKEMTLKMATLFSKKDGSYAQTEFLYSRPSIQMNFKQVLPTFDNRKIYVFNFLKSINRRLCMGIEAVYDGKGVGGSLYGRLDIGTILYGKIDREEIKIGVIKNIGMISLIYECKKGMEHMNTLGILLETAKANVHVGLENMIGRIEIQQKVGQSLGLKFGSEINLKSGNQSIGFSLNLEN